MSRLVFDNTALSHFARAGRLAGDPVDGVDDALEPATAGDPADLCGERITPGDNPHNRRTVVRFCLSHGVIVSRKATFRNSNVTAWHAKPQLMR